MKRIIFLLLLATIVMACQKGDNGDGGPSWPRNGNEVEHGMIVLGNQLEDPYSVKNMTKALASLYPEKATSLSATDLYVRFLPSSEAEYDRLVAMGVEMLDHPVDYEIVKEGDYYHDPSLGEDKITWQYAVVDKDFRFPNDITYELLDNVYIAEHQVATRAGLDVDWAAVERESFRLTGNGDLYPATKASSGGPSGRIAIIDDQYDTEPIGVAGVRVSCNLFVKFAHAYTDEQGYYQISKTYSNNPRYRLVFRNKKGFGIGFNLLLTPASFSSLGKGSPDGISVVVTKDSDRALFTRCVVNNAAYDYFEACKSESGQIKSPPSNLRIWIFRGLDRSSCVMLQQGAGIDRTVIGEFLGEYTSIVKMFLPDITLGVKSCDDYASVYAAALHELAHSSHYMQVGNAYWDKLMSYVLKSYVTSGWQIYGVGTEKDHGYCEVGEMWAYYMQTRMYRDRYPDSARSFGTSHWFYPQVLFYLDERGLTRYKLFHAFASDITDRNQLQSKLLSLYPEFKTTINQAFSRYE